MELWSVRKIDCAWVAFTPRFQRTPRPFQLFRTRVNGEGLGFEAMQVVLGVSPDAYVLD